jgi:hypothetical protein
MMIPTKQTKRLPWIISMGIVVIIILFRIFIYHPAETLSVKTVRVSGGWGYQVYVHEKLFIDQPFIPVIHGKKPFPDKQTALRVAKTVKAKLLAGERPFLTSADISNAGIDSLGNLINRRP